MFEAELNPMQIMSFDGRVLEVFMASGNGFDSRRMHLRLIGAVRLDRDKRNNITLTIQPKQGMAAMYMVQAAYEGQVMQVIAEVQKALG